MCVRALRITVLKSAGDFAHDECHDLSAEKIQRVKCFMFTRCEFVASQQFSNAGAAGWVRKFLARGRLAEVAVYLRNPSNPATNSHRGKIVGIAEDY
jgi:hypothetical protein